MKNKTAGKDRVSDKVQALVGWLNVITSPEGCTAVDARKLRECNHNLAKESWELGNSRDFYKKRCSNLQIAQKNMRDPERKMVCDILANGYLDNHKGKKENAMR